MAKSKRLDILNAKAAEKAADFELPRAPENIVRGDFNPQDEAVIDAQVNLSELKDTLEAAGLSLTSFLKSELNLGEVVSEREIRTPYGNFKAVLKHFSNEELREKCVIDEHNPRDPSERTEEILAPLINEIKHGWQTTPAIAYANKNGKVAISDGGCRYDAALFGDAGLDIEILDREPSIEVLNWLAAQSDKKTKFSVFDKGRLYTAIMLDNKWSQADLCKNGGYAAQDVSRCVSFYGTPKDILDLMPVKSMGKSLVDKFNPAIKIIVEKEAINEAVDYCQNELLAVGDKVNSKVVMQTVANKIIVFARSIQRRVVSVDTKKSVTLYENGKKLREVKESWQ